MPEGSDPEEPAEIDPDEVVDLLEVDSDADPEPIVSADDAVLEAVEDSPVAIEASPEPESVSRMDAWFAQLVHGYCPPEGAQFARPTPPTNFPGREGPPPPTVQPPSPTPQSFPTRSGGG